MIKTNKYNVKAIRMLFLSFLFIVIGIIYSCDTDETQTVARFTKLTMSDEFDTDGAPNSAIWNYDIGDGTANGLPAGWGNGELQYYTDRSDNVTVQNGLLIITAKQESFGNFYSIE